MPILTGARRRALLVLSCCLLITAVLGGLFSRFYDPPALAQPSRTITFTPTLLPADAPDVVNPMRGLHRWHNQMVAPVETDDQYRRYTWHDFETSNSAGDDSGGYTFDELERDIRAAAAEGRRYAFRIRAIRGENSGVGVPDYLARDEAYGQMVEGAWVPNWNNPYVMARWRALIDALAARYDGDPRIAFIDLAAPGRYGEGTVWTELSDATKRTYVDVMLRAFEQTRLVSMTDDEDMLFHALRSSPRVGWRRDSFGWDHFYETPYDRWGDDAEKWEMFSTRWKTAPIVAEFAHPKTDNPDRDWDGYFGRATEHLEKLGVSTISNGNMDKSWDDFSPRHRDEMLALARRAGYRYELHRVRATINADADQLTITSQWRNTGNAPTYDSWDVVYQLRQQERVVWHGTARLDLQTLLPSDTPRSFTDIFPLPDDIAPAPYDLHVLVRDPASVCTPAPNFCRAPLALAITGQQGDGSYRLGTLPVGTDAARQLPPLTNRSQPAQSAIPATPGAPSDYQLAPVADTYVRGGAYAATSFGSEHELVIKDGPLLSNEYDRRVYLQFELGRVRSRNIDRATLRLYVSGVQNNASVPLTLYAVDDTWNERTLVWKQQPVFGGQLGTRTVSTSGWIEFDVTEFVSNELLRDQTVSLLLIDQTVNNHGVDLASREHATNSPELRIVAGE